MKIENPYMWYQLECSAYSKTLWGCLVQNKVILGLTLGLLPWQIIPTSVWVDSTMVFVWILFWFSLIPTTITYLVKS